MTQSEEFFVKGLQKYLDANSAVNLFEKEVQLRVKKAISKRQSELTELFGKDWSLRDYYEAALPERMNLGQQVAFKDFCVVYIYLSFSRDERGGSRFSASASLWRIRVTLLGSLWESINAVRALRPNLTIRNDSFWLRQDSTDWDSCEKVLDAVIEEWIELWKMLGGLPRYLATQEQQIQTTRDQNI